MYFRVNAFEKLILLTCHDFVLQGKQTKPNMSTELLAECEYLPVYVEQRRTNISSKRAKQKSHTQERTLKKVKDVDIKTIRLTFPKVSWL
jgi:hypothetical protein